MKKNITINLFGTLYNIDEDAYELLDNYQKNMRRYFSSKEGGEEIANDIEYRVAELLSEIKSQGVEAITIEHVQDIVKRVGNPQEMEEDGIELDGEESAPKDNTARGTYEEPHTLGKRLFRDPKDCMLGGVLSGISHFFGIEDPLILRLLFVILVILSWSTFAIIYLVLWILIPKAVTPEDRLRMYGKPVNVDNIREEIVESFSEAKDYVAAGVEKRGGARRVITAILSVFIILFKIICIIILVGGLIALIVCTLIPFVCLIPGAADVFDFDSNFVTCLRAPSIFISWMIASAAGFIVVIHPLVGIIKSFGQKQKESSSAKIWTNFIIWLIAFIVGIGSLVFTVKKFDRMRDQIAFSNYNVKGVYVGRDGYDFLNENGFEINKLENFDISQLVSEVRVPFKGDDAKDCLDLEGSDKDNSLRYDLYKEEKLDEGDYILTGWIHTNKVNSGNAFYVKTEEGTFKDVATPSMSGNVSTLEIDRQKDLFLKNSSIDELPESIEQMNRFANYINNGWHYMAVRFHVGRSQFVKYGLSNLQQYTGTKFVGSSVILYDFKVRSVDSDSRDWENAFSDAREEADSARVQVLDKVKAYRK